MDYDLAQEQSDLDSSTGSQLQEVFISSAEEQARPPSSYEGIGLILENLDRSALKLADECGEELDKLITEARKDCVLQ